MIENPYAPPRASELALPATPAVPRAEQPIVGPVGLGGWLILPLLGTVLSSVRLLIADWTNFAPLVTGGNWQAIATPGSDSYRPALAALLVLEFLCNIAFAVAQVYLLTMAVRRLRLFPRMYIIVALCNVAFILLDMLAGYLAVPGQQLFDADSTRELLRSAIAVSVWVPYMLRSVRVRNTFTN